MERVPAKHLAPAGAKTAHSSDGADTALLRPVHGFDPRIRSVRSGKRTCGLKVGSYGNRGVESSPY